jgi:hypothetical protein
VLHVVEPFAFVGVSVFEVVDSVSIFLLVLELADVGLPVLVVVLALPVAFEARLVVSLLDTAIFEGEGARPQGLAVAPGAIEGVGGGTVGALAVVFVVVEFPGVGVSVVVLDFVAVVPQARSLFLF